MLNACGMFGELQTLVFPEIKIPTIARYLTCFAKFLSSPPDNPAVVIPVPNSLARFA